MYSKSESLQLNASAVLLRQTSCREQRSLFLMLFPRFPVFTLKFQPDESVLFNLLKSFYQELRNGVRAAVVPLCGFVLALP